MSTRVGCVGCGKRFAVAEENLKKKLPNCPACGGHLAADATSTNATAPAAAPEMASTLDLLMQSEPRISRGMSHPVIPLSLAHPRDDEKLNWLPWAIGGGGLAVIVIVGALIAGMFFRPPPQPDVSPIQRSVARKAATVETPEPEEPASLVSKLSSSEKISPTKFGASSAAGGDTPAPPPVADAKKDAKETKKDRPRVKMSVADLIEAVGDGVVHITVHDSDGEPFATGSGLIIAQHHIDQWIEPEAKGTEQPKPWKGDLWLVATNHHVVAGASKIKVRLRDGQTFEARGLAQLSRERDLAILALDQAPENLTILEPAAEGSFRQGEEVVAIGHPKGFDFTVSTGIISAIRGTKNLPEEIAQEIEAPADQQWIQTTAAITNGNSGGPLLTMFGEVVGINTWGLNSGGNLSFASHIKHTVELQKKAVDTSGKTLTVKTQAFAAAKPTDAPEKIGDRDNWLESEVREELDRSTKRALAIDWRPATKGDYTSLQTVATMLTIAAVYRYDADEFKSIHDSMRKRSWQFAKEVEVINRYAVDYLNQEKWGVFLFGKVRRINVAVRRKMWVELAGRGRVVAVTIPMNQPAPKLEVGDEIALFGYCIGMTPENTQLKREVNHVLAGLISKVTLPTIPEDTALQAAYDLIKHKYYDHEFEDNVRKFTEMFPRVIPLLGKTAVRWQRIELNARGRQFDAVRFSVPPELEADLLWSFNDPDEAIDAWGVLPVSDFPMRTDDHFISLKGITAPGLTREESKLLRLQGVADGLIVPNEDYILYFAFKDAQPRRISIAVRLVPTNSFDGEKDDGMGQVMREGAAFKSEMLARMTKALKEKPATTPEPTTKNSPDDSSGATPKDSPSIGDAKTSDDDAPQEETHSPDDTTSKTDE